MIRFRKPTELDVLEILERQRDLPLTYQSQGQTNGYPPEGFVPNDYAAEIGTGAETFRLAAEALQGFEALRLDWVEAITDGPFQPGTVLCLLTRQFGLWAINAVRVVYCTDVAEETTRSAFAVGTLPAHLMRGEEWFVVDHQKDDSVHLHVISFARPRHWLAWIAFPLVRLVQKRFARDAAENLAALVRVRSG